MGGGPEIRGPQVIFSCLRDLGARRVAGPRRHFVFVHVIITQQMDPLEIL